MNVQKRAVLEISLSEAVHITHSEGNWLYNVTELSAGVFHLET